VDGRPASPGEVGEVVITDLYNKATPMIRYRIGDLAVALDETSLCACGRSHSRIGDIEGRTQAIVHCANGKWIPGTFFAHFFKDYEEQIKFFQIQQITKGSFTLEIVRNDAFDEKEMASVVAKLRKFVGDTRIDIKYVEEIPLVRTGKRSPVVSSVLEDFQTLPSAGQMRGSN
jgi:phenylacetate-CoA ligase